MTNQQIIIVGFMGSGKTTVAHELARRLNCRAIDLDSLIAEHEGRTPGAIIERDGEEEFRKIEMRMLMKALAGTDGISSGIIALGGGAWTISENRRMIAEHKAVSVWLDAPFDLCWKRIEAGEEVRPLARSPEMARRLYDERRPLYESADVRIKVSEIRSAGETAKEVAAAILRERAAEP